MKTWIRLTNDFHGTVTTLLATDGHVGKSQIARAAKVLCPFDGCTCGEIAGTRGPQYAPEGMALVMEYESDGGATMRYEARHHGGAPVEMCACGRQTVSNADLGRPACELCRAEHEATGWAPVWMPTAEATCPVSR